MLNTLRGDGFDCLLTLIFIKMEHPRPLQVCTNVCIIFAQKGAGVIRVKIHTFWHNLKNLICIFKKSNNCESKLKSKNVYWKTGF